MKLLNVDANAKTVKGQNKGYLTGILYLAPSKTSGTDVCEHSTVGCRKACLNTAGRGKMDMVQNARVRKTKWFFEDQEAFIAQLESDITKLAKRADKKDLIPCVRLNGTSDLMWFRDFDIIEKFPDIQFYDYTKNRYMIQSNLPDNYHITFSQTEKNEKACRWALSRKINVATVFRNRLPVIHLDVPVINGDETDLRFTDEVGVVVGLKAKGRAKKDKTGFVLLGLKT